MNNHMLAARAALIVTVLSAPGAAQQSEFTSSRDNCVLYRDQGHVWVGEVHMPIGMFGTQATDPFRLSPELAEQLAPLVTTLTTAPESHGLYSFTYRLPQPRTVTDPLLLLDMDAAAVRRREGPRDENAFNEVRAAEIQIVEIVPPPFIEGFHRAEQAARELREACNQEPGPQKRQKLSDLIDAGRHALKMMEDAKADVEWIRRVKTVAPNALIGQALQRELLPRWQGAFDRYADTLGFATATSRPAPPVAIKPCPASELLAESGTPADFLDRIKSTCPEIGLEQKIWLRKAHPEATGGTTYTYRRLTVPAVAKLPPEEFEAIRSQARESLEYRKNHPYQPTTRPDPYHTLADDIRKAWGVTLREVNVRERKEFLVLGGFVVERVAEAGSPVGLQLGDVILREGKGDLYTSLNRREPFQVLRKGKVTTLTPPAP